MNNNGWISAAEELPRKGQMVLAWSESGKNQTPDLMLMVYFESKDQWIHGYYSNNMNDVTHWHPLPDPPN
jgi:hypothetical protein